MAHKSDEINENHWPGYVDALTTMLMVLTFVMMILGIAVFTASQNVSRSLIEKIARAAKVDIPSEATSLQEVSEHLVSRLEADAEKPSGQKLAGRAQKPGDQVVDGPAVLLDETRRLQSSAVAHIPTAPPEVQTLQRGDGFRIDFQPRSTRLDDATSEAINRRFASEPSWRGAVRIEIRANVDSAVSSVSDARRIAYYRAAIIRSAAIRSGINADRIRMILAEESAAGPAAQSVRVIAFLAPAQTPAVSRIAE